MKAHRPLRFGVLGTSRIAYKSGIPAILASRRAELAMVGSRSKEKGERYAAEFGAQAGSYDNVIATPDIDAVYIALPNTLHAEWAVKALNAGKHVWCEKPAALSFEEAKNMAAAARANRVRLMEGFMFLSHPQHKKVMELIHAGMLGRPMEFTGRFYFSMSDHSNIRLKEDLGGGTYNDMAVHVIRASRMVFECEPETVECRLTLNEDGVDIRAELKLIYDKGVASITTRFDDDYAAMYEVSGPRASVKVPLAYAVPRDKDTEVILISEGGRQTTFSFEPVDQFRLMLDEFCDEVALGSASKRRYEDELLDQTRILSAGRLSDKERRPVRLSEV